MPERSEGRGWPVLFGVGLGVFAPFLDSTVVSLALSEITKDLGTSAGELQWVMSIYLLVLAVKVVTLGRLGDMFGRRWLYVLGV